MPDRLPPNVRATTAHVLGCAIKVHRALGPGLLESAYRACLAYELRRSGLAIALESPVPVTYEEVRLDCGYRLDVVANDLVIVEVKSVKELQAIHTAQVLTYLKLTGYPVALLINFNVTLLVGGARRLINPRPAERFRV